MAIFDIDGTLIRPSTGWFLTRAMRRQRVIRRRDVARGMYYTALLKLNRLNYEDVVRDAMNVLEGRHIDDVRSWFREIFLDGMKDSFLRTVLDRLAAHHQNGDYVMLLSGTSQVLGEIIAEYMPVDEVICADAKREDDRITRTMVQPIPYREGKVFWAEQSAARINSALSAATFYSDSMSDFPLLQAVGTPVIVHPDPFLRRRAKKNGWEIIKDDDRVDLTTYFSASS